jgi:hypothetical protein
VRSRTFKREHHAVADIGSGSNGIEQHLRERSLADRQHHWREGRCNISVASIRRHRFLLVFLKSISGIAAFEGRMPLRNRSLSPIIGTDVGREGADNVSSDAPRCLGRAAWQEHDFGEDRR